MDIGITADSALDEMRSVIAGLGLDGAPLESNGSAPNPDEIRGRLAYGLIANIFEDIYQGLYGEAYGALTVDEKTQLLILAGSGEDTGIATDFILSELLKLNAKQGISVFRERARRIDGDSSFPQEAVTIYLLAVYACARHSDEFPSFDEGRTCAQRAWARLGRILYLHWQPTGDQNAIQELWTELQGEELLAFSDVLYQLTRSQWRGSLVEKLDLASIYSSHIHNICRAYFASPSRVDSVFNWGGSKDSALAPFMVELLGRLGDMHDLAILEPLAENAVLGPDVIAAVRQIRQRSAC